LFDWNRVGLDGKAPRLHARQSLRALISTKKKIDFRAAVDQASGDWSGFASSARWSTIRCFKVEALSMKPSQFHSLERPYVRLFSELWRDKSK